jgi:hypothetical protein
MDMDVIPWGDDPSLIEYIVEGYLDGVMAGMKNSSSTAC